MEPSAMLSQSNHVDPADEALQRAFSMLKDDWVCEFMFPTDSNVYFNQLYHALSQKSAITTEINILTHNYSRAGDNRYGLDEQMKVLSLPSYSIGFVTVGFEITERVKNATLVPINSRFYISRFVRDDRKGLFLIMAEHSHLGITEIICCRQISPGCRTQLVSVMRAQPLRQALSSLNQGYETEAVRRATMFAYFAIDTRSCPSCGNSTAAFCQCKIPLKRKLHAMDYDNEFNNLSTYCGGYEGVAKTSVYGEGQESYVASFLSKVNATFTTDLESRQRLSFWAIRDALGANPFCLRNFKVPGVNTGCAGPFPLRLTSDEMGQPVEERTNDRNDSKTKFAIGWSVKGNAHLTTAQGPREPPLLRTGSRSSELGFTPELEADLTISPPAVTLSENQEMSTTTCRAHSATSLGNQMSILTTENPSFSETLNISAEGRRRCGSNADALLVHVHGEAHEQAKGASANSEAGPIIQVEQVFQTVLEQEIENRESDVSRMGQTSGGGNIVYQRQGNVLVPMLLTPLLLLSNGSGIATHTPPLAPAPGSRLEAPLRGNDSHEEPRTRDQIRRARNRASAQRSNEKKRKEIQNMKNDLSDCLKRAEFLREMEQRLLEENRSLKQALSIT